MVLFVEFHCYFMDNELFQFLPPTSVCKFGMWSVYIIVYNEPHQDSVIQL